MEISTPAGFLITALFRANVLYSLFKDQIFSKFDFGFHLTRKEIDDKVAEVFENVKLGETLYRMPSELSGWMRK